MCRLPEIIPLERATSSVEEKMGLQQVHNGERTASDINTAVFSQQYLMVEFKCKLQRWRL